MRYFIQLAYKGTDFHGWQSQPNADSVQERIETALSTLLKKTTPVIGAGRTDTGVHASQYYAHFDTGIEVNENEFAYKLNALLPHTVTIFNIFKVKDDAHARFDATSRSYEYRILLENNPFLLDTTWQLQNRKFDVDLMNEAAQILLNHSDFKAFSKSKTDVNNYFCTITKALWILNKSELTFYISANRFLRNMVRAIVGTLLEVGERKMSLKEFEQVILSQNRSEAGLSVPAKGLFLTEIKYNDFEINASTLRYTQGGKAQLTKLKKLNISILTSNISILK
jgi:tRNA pseudouridine38-40 synthase